MHFCIHYHPFTRLYDGTTAPPSNITKSLTLQHETGRSVGICGYMYINTHRFNDLRRLIWSIRAWLTMKEMEEEGNGKYVVTMWLGYHKGLKWHAMKAKGIGSMSRRTPMLQTGRDESTTWTPMLLAAMNRSPWLSGHITSQVSCHP
jgi:hypothetical protein